MEKEYAYGVYPTMLTPYRANGSIDICTAEKHVEWYFSKGCAGIFALCRTSMNGGNNFHDANYSTFHRIKNFRTEHMVE